MLPDNINELNYFISYTYNTNEITSHFFAYKDYLVDLKFVNNYYIFETYNYSNNKGFINKHLFDYLHYKYETIEIENFLKSLNIFIETEYKKIREKLIINILQSSRKIKINKIIK